MKQTVIKSCIKIYMKLKCFILSSIKRRTVAASLHFCIVSVISLSKRHSEQ